MKFIRWELVVSKDPSRLVFNVAAGPALNASIVDMGNRFRMIVNTVDAIAPQNELPNFLWQGYCGNHTQL